MGYCQLHIPKPGMPDLLRLLHFTLVTFWTRCHVRRVGTRLDDTSLRLAIALRLGAIMCAPHTCVCGVQVGGDGTHGLACRKSAGRQMRHNAVNDLIKRALVSANVPSLLEPKFVVPWRWQAPRWLDRVPWANGRCLVWDFTCPDTLAASHLNRAVLGSGVVANDAESRKSIKYSSLSALYRFIPIAIETLGVPGDEALSFFHDLGQRMQLPQLNHVHSSSWCNVWVLQYNVATQLASSELCPLLLAGTNFFTFNIDTLVFKF